MGGYAVNSDLQRSAFAAQHPLDRNFYLAMLLAIWAAIIIGFGLDIRQRRGVDIFAYPLIVHVHALVFVGWLLLLTT